MSEYACVHILRVAGVFGEWGVCGLPDRSIGSSARVCVFV